MSSATIIDQISSTDLSTITSRALLLDVRTPAEFAGAHIEGSVLHPLSDLDPGAVSQLARDKEGIVVVCQSGGRAGQAAGKLATAGITKVRVLQGGVSAWEKAGLPLVHGKKTISLERQVRIVAGALVFTGAVLGYFVHPGWIGISAFVGGGLVFAGLTDWCGMGLLLARMPWNR
ncbi:MAG: rhodanese-like domain-containing protein [Candidatus Methylacidiphilales bacterium]|nr:rhodanese-like domain-containing protein [Candidatus Methylacidiphilales bacterium]